MTNLNNSIKEQLEVEKDSLDDLFLRKAVRMLWAIRDTFAEDGATKPVIESLALLADISIERASEAVDSFYEKEFG